MGPKATKLPFWSPPAKRGGYGRMLIAPVLVLSILSAIVVSGLAAWVVDHQITANNYPRMQRPLYTEEKPNGTCSCETVPDGGPRHLSRFEGNAATSSLLNTTLSAGVVAVASYIVGLHHLRVRTHSSLSTAQGAAWITFLLLMLPFALAWKEIDLRGRGVGLIVLEAFVILHTVVHFLYTLLLYADDK